jgi:hypothetical protein
VVVVKSKGISVELIFVYLKLLIYMVPLAFVLRFCFVIKEHVDSSRLVLYLHNNDLYVSVTSVIDDLLAMLGSLIGNLMVIAFWLMGFILLIQLAPLFDSSY